MEAEARTSADGIGEALAARPEAYEFSQLVRLLWLEASRLALETDDPEPPALRDVLRFRTHATLAFPASEVQDLDLGELDEFDDQAPTRAASTVTVNFMGLTGLSGALPHHYTQFVSDRSRRRDHNARDFLDIFNDVFLRLFALAWEKNRPYLPLERTDSGDSTKEHLRALVGLATDALGNRLDNETASLPDEAIIEYAGLLGRTPASAKSIEHVLALMLGLPVAVRPFSRRWLGIPPEHRATVGTACLGDAVAIGAYALDYSSTFSVEVGPMKRPAFDTLLPKARLHERVAAVVRFAAGPGLDFLLVLKLAEDEAPRLQLGGSEGSPARLGQNTWLNGNAEHVPAMTAGFRIEGAGVQA